jgi:hypothetical protein
VFKALTAGLLGAVLAAALYVSAVIAFPRLRQPPPAFGVDAYSGADQLFAIRLSASGLLIAGVGAFALGFLWMRRRQRRQVV